MSDSRFLSALVLVFTSYSLSAQYPSSYCTSDGIVSVKRNFLIPDSDTLVQLTDSGRCEGGKPVGIWVSRYVGNGKLFSQALFGDSTSFWYDSYYPNGMIESHDSVSIKGKEEFHQSFDSEGVLIGSTIIRNGAIRDVSYHPNGRISSECYRSYPFSASERYVRRMYSEDGSLFDETEYVDGQKDGISKRYRVDGTLLYECTYQRGQLEGQYKKYDEHGVIKEVLLYNGGLKM